MFEEMEKMLPLTPDVGEVGGRFNKFKKSIRKFWDVFTVFLTQIISRRQKKKKCLRESCIMDFTSAKIEFASTIFKKMYFSKYSIQRSCKQIASI